MKRPRAGDPFDTFPKNFWQEFSSPFTDIPDAEELENIQITTHEPCPFFADYQTTINVSAQLGSNVNLHCRVNELQGKTVSFKYVLDNTVLLLIVYHKIFSEYL